MPVADPANPVNPTTDPAYEDTLALLRQLIRNACVNDLTADSGEEYRNADTLTEFFADTQVKIQRFEPHPGRVSVAFTVPGADPAAEPLTLLGHIDVVPVDRPKWSIDPFGAEIIDGALYGRGAVDMLFITAIMAQVTREIARRAAAGHPPAGTLTFVALADEEARGGLGAKWISEYHPNAFSWRNCLSETGGSHLPARDGSDAVVIYVGEKGAAQRRLHVSGDPGHGSTPRGKDSAIVTIAEVARRLAAIRPPITESSVWRGFVQAFRFDEGTERALLDGSDPQAFEAFGPLASYADAFSHLTIAQTVLRAGTAINVLPSHAWLELDIRPLPGTTQDEVDELLRAGLGDLAETVTIERLISEAATESPTNTPLYQALSETCREFFPDAAVVPVFATGGSDLRFARQLGGVGYGFAMHARERTIFEANRQLHAHDEHLMLEDLALSLRAYRRLVERFLT